jgi:hypothetical protein
MKSQHLSEKLLDTAISSMQRNRTLLFTINLIAALILVVVYMERYSFDMKQREGHLIAYKDRCKELNQGLPSVPHWNDLSADDQNSFKGCADLDKIQAFVISNTENAAQLEALSVPFYKLRRIRNEMNTVKLPEGSVAPLGIGVPVSRNDMVIICGFLMLILYTWLAFSFEQLARITAKIKQMYPEPRSAEAHESQATVKDLVDVNFLFRTDEPGLAAFFVKVLYLLAPISMTVATLNNLYFDTTKGFADYLRGIMHVPLMIQAMLVVAMWVIGYNVTKSDDKVTVASEAAPGAPVRKRVRTKPLREQALDPGGVPAE